MKNNFSEKGISTILIVVIIVIVAVVGNVALYYYIQNSSPKKTETPENSANNIQTDTEQKTEEQKEELFSEETYKDETADWLVYTNNDYNYSIKYPKDWTNTYTGTEKRKFSIGFLPPSSKKESILTENNVYIDYIGDVIINIAKNPDKKSISDFYSSEFYDYFNLAKGGNYKVKLGGKEGIRFKDVIGDPGIKFDIIVIPLNEENFIEFSGSQLKISDNLKTFEKMLSTFKFID
jgi:hypothetical protein